MNQHFQAIATVLSLVNPAICAAIFSKIESGRSRAAITRDAITAVVVIAIILGLAALFGANVLKTFAISLDAFSVAGGFVLAWMGFGMIKGAAAQSPSPSDPVSQDAVSLSPLILFAASPGTITGVITLAVAHSGTGFPVTALVAIAVAALVTLAVMLLLARYGGNRQGSSLIRQTITNLMGLIVLAMGFQFALSGFKAFME
jgi:multiple antibiotic resistance protein